MWLDGTHPWLIGMSRQNHDPSDRVVAPVDVVNIRYGYQSVMLTSFDVLFKHGVS